MALLVGLVRGASWYNPRRNPERSLERRNLVIELLAADGQLATEFAHELKARPLGVLPKTPIGVSAFPGFMQLVKQQLRQDYRDEDLRSEGLVVFTTFDPIVQLAAEQASIEVIAEREASLGLPEGALETASVIASVANGEVLAMIGGRDPRYPGFNRAMESRRQIGSLVKPVVYLNALRKRDTTLTTMIDDSPIVVEQRSGDWSPQNYDGNYHGRVRLIDALVNSYNVPTVRVGLDVGLERIRDSLYTMGAAGEIKPYPSILLGAVEMPLLDITQMYQTIAANGYRTPLRSILQVVDPNGQVLTRYPLEVQQAVSPELAYLLVAAMHEVTVTGTASRLQDLLPESLPVAGKTGTTDQQRDSWFAGFSGEHVAVSWIGRDDNQPTGLSGSSGAMLVWAAIMNKIPTRPLKPAKPENVAWHLTDRATGLLADGRCAQTQWIPYIAGTEPTRMSDCVRRVSAPSDEPENGGLKWLRNLLNGL